MATSAYGAKQSFQLPTNGYLAGVNFSGYGGHDPYLSRANPYANGASQAGALGVGPTAGGFSPFGNAFGGGNLNPMLMAGQFQSAHNRANDANEARYQDILSGYGGREGRVRALADKATLGMQEAFAEKWKNTGVKALAPFKNFRGTNTSSVKNAVMTGLARQQTIDEGNLARNMLDIQLIPEQYSRATDDFKYSKTENGPDPNRMDRLAAAGGEADGGGGGLPNSPSPNQPFQGWGVNPNTTPYSRRTGPSLGQLRNWKKRQAQVAAVGAKLPVPITNPVGVVGSAIAGAWGKVFNKPLSVGGGSPVPTPLAGNPMYRRPGMSFSVPGSNDRDML